MANDGLEVDAGMDRRFDRWVDAGTAWPYDGDGEFHPMAFSALFSNYQGGKERAFDVACNAFAAALTDIVSYRQLLAEVLRGWDEVRILEKRLALMQIDAGCLPSDTSSDWEALRQDVWEQYDLMMQKVRGGELVSHLRAMEILGGKE